MNAKNQCYEMALLVTELGLYTTYSLISGIDQGNYPYPYTQ